MAKVKELTGRQNVGLALTVLLHRLNSVLRGRCAYFRPGVSNVAFCCLSHSAWMMGHLVDMTQTPRDHVEAASPPLLRRRLVARHGGENCSTRQR
ncbi:group II intron maturase-specific domain-containing protein [Kitasatospora sp. NPDC058115]|uniref:group II intron maturase-specific domain-containing protein n=1 Tax=Kitasatospora sp. NPDC058115 TaxID=3346347 RepID=UPI0036D8864E